MPLLARQQEIDARQARAIDRAKRLDRQPLHLRDGRGRQVRGNHGLRSVVEILGLVVVELARRQDLAGHRGFRIVVAEDGAFDLTRVGHRGFDDHLAIELRGRVSIAGTSSSRVFTFEMPTLDPRLAGLTKTGSPSLPMC